jgi:hypothetical protein
MLYMEDNKKKAGRPKKYNSVEEFKDMKRDVNQGLKEKGYFKDYYIEKKGAVIKCEHCGVENLNPFCYNLHLKSIKCRKARGEDVIDGRSKGNRRKKDHKQDNKLQVYEINVNL